MAGNWKDFSLRLKEAAGAAGVYSPRELARLLDVDASTVKQWYDGKSMPSARNLASLIGLLNVRYEWLVHGQELEGAMVGYADPASAFTDAVAVLTGMGRLLADRSQDLTREDAEKIGRTIIKTANNAEQAFQSLLQAYLDQRKHPTG